MLTPLHRLVTRLIHLYGDPHPYQTRPTPQRGIPDGSMEKPPRVRSACLSAPTPATPLSSSSARCCNHRITPRRWGLFVVAVVFHPNTENPGQYHGDEQDNGEVWIVHVEGPQRRIFACQAAH